eukprot:1392784-Amorphochlora_amoeboformis.AAC.2
MAVEIRQTLSLQCPMNFISSAKVGEIKLNRLLNCPRARRPSNPKQHVQAGKRRCQRKQI